MSIISESYTRPIMLTHDLIGGKWKLRILWHIIHGNNRYSMILRGMSDISEKVLSSQLKELEKNKLIEKNIISDKPPKVIEYRISAGQEQLIELVEVICSFTESYALAHNINIHA